MEERQGGTGNEEVRRQLGELSIRKLFLRGYSDKI
jgi:hypothetical protein